MPTVPAPGGAGLAVPWAGWCAEARVVGCLPGETSGWREAGADLAGEDLDAVRGGELGEAGRIGRDGFGQPQVAGRLAGGGDELVESAW